MTTTEKIKEVATNKWTIISTVLSLVGVGGVTQIGIPVFDRIEAHVVEIKNNDQLIIEGQKANYDMAMQIYITRIVDLYLKYPPNFVDSILDDVEKDVFWEMNR